MGVGLGELGEGGGVCRQFIVGKGGGGGEGGGFRGGEGGGSHGCGVLCVGCVVKEHDLNPENSCSLMRAPF